MFCMCVCGSARYDPSVPPSLPPSLQLHKADPRSFASSYCMRHGRARERCGILRRATHGYLEGGKTPQLTHIL